MKLNSRALRQCLALDLSDEKGLLCGEILATLGVDVIKVEPPGGDKSRNIGPFYKDIPSSEKSLYWFAYNANKKSITLDIRTSDGEKILKRLVESADFLIESFAPDTSELLGLGYEQLRSINPRLIAVSITPFGRTGPYRDYKTCDLVAMAMSGLLFLTGNPERPPVRVGFPQAYLHAGAEAAVGAMIAYYERCTSGLGQQVDVSIQQSIVVTTTNTIPNWVVDGLLVERLGGQRSFIRGLVLPQTWKCLDGSVGFTIFGGLSGAKSISAMVKWMDQEGMANDFLKSIDWVQLDFAILTQDIIDRFVEPIKGFFMKHTMKELYDGSVQRAIILYPVASARDLVENVQLKARNFWRQVAHNELDNVITYPGDPLIAEDLLREDMKPSPSVGANNEEIYINELGFSRMELVMLKENGVI